MLKILVTGALGHIGSRLLQDLPMNFPDSKILLFDNLLTQRYSSLFNLNRQSAFEFVQIDLVDADLSSYFKGASVVVHLAALTEASQSAISPELYEKTNLAMTKNLAEHCARFQVPLIFPSSCSVYSPQSQSVDETAEGINLQSQSPYAKVKLKEEEILKFFAREQDLKFTILRLGTIAGPSVGMRFHTAVNSFCWNAVMKKPLNVWETALDQRRPYLSVDDCSRAIVHLIQKQLFENQTYNLLNENLTVRDIVEIIKVKLPETQFNLVKSSIMNSLSYTVLDKKIRSTQFEYRVSIEQSIFETLKLFEAFTKK